MIRLGHSSPAFCHDAIPATAGRIAEQGFDVWEIVGEGGHDVWANRVAFRKALADHGLDPQVHAPLSDANLGSLVPRAWEQSIKLIEESLRGAHAIEARSVTIHPGNHTPLSRGHYPKLHAAAKRAVKRLDRTGRRLGLALCLENMPTGWAFETDSLEKLEDLVAGTEFKLCLDLGHAHVAKRVPEFVRAARRIGNIHLSDNQGDLDAHLTVGDGTVPWKESLRTLHKGGYRGTVVIESRSHDSGAESRRRVLTTVQRLGD